METTNKFYKDHRFLLIDDDPQLRNHSLNLLLQLGFKQECIDTAVDGQDALEKINQENSQYEFFIIDLVMPNMNGIDLLKNLQQIDKYKETPKLVLSSEEDHGTIFTAISAGAHNYALKPSNIETLAKKMLECIDR